MQAHAKELTVDDAVKHVTMRIAKPLPMPHAEVFYVNLLVWMIKMRCIATIKNVLPSKNFIFFCLPYDCESQADDLEEARPRMESREDILTPLRAGHREAGTVPFFAITNADQHNYLKTE